MDNAVRTIDLVMLVDDNDTDNFISKRIVEITKFARRVEVKNSGKSALAYVPGAPRNNGACMPPYFIFQARVDGHE